MIREFAEDLITQPGAQLWNWLVRALRPTKPTALEPDHPFDRMQAQLEAIHELRVWRAVRNMASEPPGCPPQPRLVRKVLSPEELKHVETCDFCQAAINKTRLPTITLWFEKIEQWWRGYKATNSSFSIRVVQATVLTVMITACVLLVSSFPIRATTRRMTEAMIQSELSRANGDADEIARLQKDRDNLNSNVTQLHTLISMLDQRSKESQAEEQRLAVRLNVVTKQLTTLRTKHQELLRAVDQERGSFGVPARAAGHGDTPLLGDCRPCAVQGVRKR